MDLFQGRYKGRAQKGQSDCSDKRYSDSCGCCHFVLYVGSSEFVGQTGGRAGEGSGGGGFFVQAQTLHGSVEYVQALCSHSGDEVALLPRMTQSAQSLVPKIGLLSKLAQYPQHTDVA